jgi:hypothetical protein
MSVLTSVNNLKRGDIKGALKSPQVLGTAVAAGGSILGKAIRQIPGVDTKVQKLLRGWVDLPEESRYSPEALRLQRLRQVKGGGTGGLAGGKLFLLPVRIEDL